MINKVGTALGAVRSAGVGNKGRIIAHVFAGLLVIAPFISSALDYEYRFNTTFSGTGPSGPPPWIDAVFHDVTNGTVSLTISNNGLSGSEFIGGLYFNLNTNLNATSLSFQLIQGSANSAAMDIQTGRDQFKADGDGKYDILLDFDTTSGRRFDAGDYLVYQITGIPNLNVLDFDYLSAPAGGSGPFLAAAHVQGVGSMGLSGWIRPNDYTPVLPVPEPSTVALLGLGSFLFLARRLRR